MNALYNIFAGINIFDCISFQHDEESDHGKLRCAAESVPAGRDNYVLSTGQGAEGEDQLTEEEAGEDRWKWPEGFNIPSELNDPIKLALLENIISQIDEKSKELRINYHARAKRTNLELNKVTVLRYLEGAQWKDPPAGPWGPAAERVLDTVDWRLSVPMPVKDRPLMRKELMTGKFFVGGLSKNGRPVLYIRIGRENTWDPRGNLLSLVYSIERAIAAMDCNTCEMVAVVDCAGVGMMNAPSTAFIKLAIEVMGKHYPRRNGQVFIVNVSSVFYMVWNLISMTLTEVTKKRIQILTSDTAEMRARIGELVDPSVLLREYGGDAGDEFDVEKYLDGDPNMC